MESCIIPWPIDENWKVTQSRVEGDGRTVVFQLQRSPVKQAGEETIQMIWLGKDEIKWEEFFQLWKEEFISNKPEVQIIHLDTQSPLPGYVFLIQTEEVGKGSLGYCYGGEEISVMLFHSPVEKDLPREELTYWLSLFQSIEFVSQPLWQSLQDSGLLPRDIQAKSLELAPKERVDSVLPDYLQGYAHPSVPTDVFYYSLDEKGHLKGPFWGRFLKEVEENLVLVMQLSDNQSATSYLQWDVKRKVLIEISTQGLALRKEGKGSICQHCGFASWDPFLLKPDTTQQRVIICPFCYTPL
ncbi:MAG: hypothetical protein AAFY71_06890 [Bacteroidota bacterium]